MADKYIQVTINLDEAKPHIYKSNEGAHLLTFQVSPKKNGAGENGVTHSVGVRYLATDGAWYTQYIGSGKEKEFGGAQRTGTLPPPAQTNGASARPSASQAAQAAQAQAPQAPAQQAPVAAPAPAESTDDLPF